MFHFKLLIIIYFIFYIYYDNLFYIVLDWDFEVFTRIIGKTDVKIDVLYRLLQFVSYIVVKVILLFVFIIIQGY